MGWNLQNFNVSKVTPFMVMDFNLSTYSAMLCRAKSAGYSFAQFADIDEIYCASAQGMRICLLRHDVDADIFAALTMATLEHDLGICANYFVMLRSPVYNLMSRHNHMMVERILGFGHSIGLHYDQGFDAQRGLTHHMTTKAIEQEALWLEAQFHARVAAVSFHQPGPAVLRGEISLGTRVNTYDKERLAHFDYYSDSNRHFLLGQTAVGGMMDAIAALAPINLQLLIHPMWWVYDDTTTAAVWDQVIKRNFQLQQEQLLATERAYGGARLINLLSQEPDQFI